MKAKEFLRSIRELNTQIDRKIQKMSDLKLMSTSIGSFDYSKDRVQSSTSPDAPYVKMIDKMTDLEDEINADIDRFVDMKQQAEQLMILLSDKQKAVIRFRYFEGYTWDKIADVLQCTVRNVHYIHGDALAELDDQGENHKI